MTEGVVLGASIARLVPPEEPQSESGEEDCPAEPEKPFPGGKSDLGQQTLTGETDRQCEGLQSQNFVNDVVVPCIGVDAEENSGNVTQESNRDFASPHRS